MLRRVALVVFLHSVLRLLVTDNVFPSSPILFTLMMEALGFSETSVLAVATRRNIPAKSFFIVTAVKTTNLTYQKHVDIRKHCARPKWTSPRSGQHCILYRCLRGLVHCAMFRNNVMKIHAVNSPYIREITFILVLGECWSNALITYHVICPILLAWNTAGVCFNPTFCQ
jgi:hypothetical protein